MIRHLFATVEGEGDAGRHLDDEELAVAAEAGGIDGLDRNSARHLARCDACRESWRELRAGIADLEGIDALDRPPADLERAAAGAGGPRRSFIPLAVAATLLVAAGAALIVPWQRFGAPGPLRSETADTAPLTPLSPAGDVAADEPLRFRWLPLDGEATYRVIVADADGSVVLRLDGVSPGATPGDADRARLTPGREYRWMVRASRGAGRTVTGSSAVFRIRGD